MNNPKHVKLLLSIRVILGCHFAPGQAILLLKGGSTGLNLCICGHYWGKRLKYFNAEAFYWTATMQDKRNVWIRHFISRASIDRVPNPNDLKMSVRCVKDVQ